MSKHFSNEYREYVAKMVVEEGKKAKDLSYELEIPYSTINRWIKQYKEKQAASQPKEYMTPSELEKQRRQHEKEVKALQEEIEILKKAMHIFTRKPE